MAGPELLDNERLKLSRRATLCLSFKQAANFRASEPVPHRTARSACSKRIVT
jgi:hypothetical protein